MRLNFLNIVIVRFLAKFKLFSNINDLNSVTINLFINFTQPLCNKVKELRLFLEKLIALIFNVSKLSLMLHLY